MAEALINQLELLPGQEQSTVKITKQQSYDSGIHKLPPELLLQIFEVGEASERAIRPSEQSYLGVQDIATQVCSHWRNLAITCPNLWAYIHITRSGPRNLTALYLARAGPGTLLDLNINIRSEWCEGLNIDLESHYKVVEELLTFLASHGASVSCWKTLSVCSPEPDVLLRFTGVLSIKTAPALWFLSCKLCRHGRLDDGGYIRDASNAYQLSPFVVPRFRFDRLSWCRVFDQSSPMLSGMTELRFTSWPSRCTPSQLQKLLLLNPQLELLFLGTSDLHKWESIHELEFFTDCQSIRMVQLHTLSVDTIKDLYWVLGVLKLIDAPVLKKLSISSFVCTERFEPEARYLCRLPSEDEEGDTTLGKPQYPALDELDIHNFFHREHVIDMLASWPSITRLYASRAQVELLGDPSMLHNLAYLKIHFKSHPELGRILSWREAVGFRVKEVDLPMNGWQNKMEEELPSEIAIRKHNVLDFEIASDDSATEAESSVQGESGTDSETESWVNEKHDSDSEGSCFEESEWVWSVHD